MSKVRAFICAPKETHPRDLINDDILIQSDFECLFGEHSLTNFIVIQVLFLGHCVRVLDFRSVRTFGS